MNQNEYQNKMAEYTALRQELITEMQKLDEEYLKENCPFAIKDKVIFEDLDNETLTVYIKRIRLSRKDGELDFDFYKSKKDGSISKQSFYGWKVNNLRMAPNE